MTRNELLHNSGYWVAKIQIDLYNQLNSYITRTKTTQTKLAEKMGVTKGYISQILNGDFDYRISKLVELSLAIGKVPKIEYEDIDQFIYKDEVGYKEIRWDLMNNLNNNDLYKSDDTNKVETSALIVPMIPSVTPIHAQLS